MNCPICGRFTPAGSPRCTSCGADFRDPDVLALASQPAAPALAPAGVAEGALGNDRMLWMTGEGIADGTSPRRVALIGGVALVAGGLAPRGWGDGASVATILPLALGALGLVLFFVGRKALGAVELGALLAIGGAAELVLGLTPFGELAGTATELPVLEWFGVAIAGVGIAIRVLRPTDPHAAWVIAAGGLLFVTGSLLPSDDVSARLPLELRLLSWNGEEPDGSTIAIAFDALDGGGFLFTVGAAMLVPVVAIPVATMLAFRRPAGVWDAPGNTLRAIGTATVLWLPLVHGMALFNVIGWPGGGEEADRLTFGRARLLLLSTGAMLYLTAGATALYVAFRARAAQKG